jgi:hypothetical protein
VEQFMTDLSTLPYFKFPPRSVSVPTVRCDQCRRGLGRHLHHYSHMRFCSPACMTAYQQKLDEETRVKIRHLEVIPNSRW